MNKEYIHKDTRTDEPLQQNIRIINSNSEERKRICLNSNDEDLVTEYLEKGYDIIFPCFDKEYVILVNKFQREIEEKDKEIERLKNKNNDLRKIYRNTYNRLFQNGNDELAEYFQAQIDDCPTFYVEPIIDYAKEWRDYQARIDKALQLNEIIDKKLRSVNSVAYYELDDLIFKQYQILKGEDEE